MASIVLCTCCYGDVIQSKEVTTLKHRLSSQEEEVAMVRNVTKSNQQLQEVWVQCGVHYVEYIIIGT